MYITINTKHVGDCYKYEVFKEHKKIKNRETYFLSLCFLFYSQIVPVAIPVGATPTGTLVITVFVAISITETVLLA